MSKSPSKIKPAVRSPGKTQSVGAAQRGPDIASILLRSLTERWLALVKQVGVARRRPTEKAIHDLRVATRRLIATLDILENLLPQAAIPKIRRQLKRHLRALSVLRDLQVQLLAVRDLLTQFPSLRLFLTVLMVREKQLIKQARREITRVRVKSAESLLIRIEGALESLLADPMMREVGRIVVLGSMGKAFAKAARLRNIAMTGNAEQIHRFRVAFKRLRYTIEALQPILPAVTPGMLKAMNEYQNGMGAVQDIDVLIASVNSYALRRGRIGPDQFLPLSRHLLNRRKELIEKFLASVDEFALFWQSVH